MMGGLWRQARLQQPPHHVALELCGDALSVLAEPVEHGPDRATERCRSVVKNGQLLPHVGELLGLQARSCLCSRLMDLTPAFSQEAAR